MTRKKIVDTIALETGLTKGKIVSVLHALKEVMISVLKKEGRFPIVGFGIFSVRHRKGRRGRSPRTGETLLLPPKDYLVFKPSQKLNERLNR